MPSTPELRRLAAACVAVGFEGSSPDRHVLDRLHRLQPAGIILFARNVAGAPSAVRELVDTVAGAIGADLPPIVTIDQEGGRVMRLHEDVSGVPSMMALAATGDLALAERVGYQLGYDCARAGVNVDFAPVLDLAIEPDNTVIGARSFGRDPQLVTEFGTAVGRGLERAGVIATYKHFPGYGSTAVDSHLDLPVIDLDMATLRGRDLIPFANAVAAGARALMCAHILIRGLDPDRPATLSPAALTGLLRDELGFDGVCFTDCLEMLAIAKPYGTAQGALEAIRAGADCALISHTLELAEHAVDLIAAAAAAGTLPLARLEQAAARMRRLRAGFVRPAPAPPARDAGAEAARRSITLVHGDPLLRGGGAVVISFDGRTVEGVEGAVDAQPFLADALRAREVAVRALTFPLDVRLTDIPPVPAPMLDGMTRAVIVARRAHVYPEQARAIARYLEQLPDAIVVSAREPFDVPLLERAGAATLLCTYGDERVSMTALADVLTGSTQPTGKLPLSPAALGSNRA